jgi:multicomponent Na+:H+ antiporter subunit G
MIPILIASCITLGVLFMLIAALGIVRFPDLFSRMHAASKASTLGISLILLAYCLSQPTTYTVIKSLLTMLFIFLTVPVACHLLSRAVLRQQKRPQSCNKR